MIKVTKTAKTLNEGIMNMTIVRNVAYRQIGKINKNIKEIIEVDNTLLDMIDINMKNAINKIINNYKVYQQTGVLKIK
jgi:regulator of replication initiation timing